jgi:hypothetical protein
MMLRASRNARKEAVDNGKSVKVQPFTCRRVVQSVKVEDRDWTVTADVDIARTITATRPMKPVRRRWSVS